MARQVKELAAKPDDLSSVPQDRRELTLKSCPLTTHTHTHTHTHTPLSIICLYIQNKFVWFFFFEIGFLCVALAVLEFTI
jgi:hypothetical protein